MLETHLTLHATYGVPYLPGTALKGIAARYFRRYLDDNAFSQVLYGNKDAAANLGYYDALPVADQLADLIQLDVLTPHHQKYYQTGESAPRDDDSPNPVQFLSVQGKFQVALGWNGNPDDPAAQEWLEISRQILLQALEQEGLGGKTNAGYGRIVGDREGEASGK